MKKYIKLFFIIHIDRFIRISYIKISSLHKEVSYMYYRFQFDILSSNNPIEYFLDQEVSKALDDIECERIVMATITIPGIMIHDSNLPVFSFYQLEDDKIYDKHRAIIFCDYLKQKYKNMPQIKSKKFKDKGFIVDEYIVSLDYIIIKKSSFDNYIVGNFKEIELESAYKDLFESAYADFMINMNIIHKIKKDTTFSEKNLDFFQENTKTKIQLLEHYIDKYNFCRYMKYNVQSIVGKIQFVKTYL